MAPSSILLAVTGSIAAYKAVDVASTLVQRGYDVRPIMTAAATRFVAPLSFESITGHTVLTDIWSEQPDLHISHVRLGDLAALLAVVPATADAIARLAHGLADDALTATALATTAPLLLAPAMNRDMWQHPATQANLATLVARGAHVVGPETGYLAEGITGVGRLAAPLTIVETIEALLKRRQDLRGHRVIVTAGPTHEPIDPVRYLTNRSSGKMGYALASAARDRGAQVVLISGPVALPPPPGLEIVRVGTAHQMLAAVQQALVPDCTLIMAAAVADYAPADPRSQKLKRGDSNLILTLVPNPDILRSLSRPPGIRVVAFAAETESLLAHGAAKLARKGADLLVANDVGEPGAGFESDTNHVWLIRADWPPEEVPAASKRVVADAILDALFAEPMADSSVPTVQT